MALSPATTDTSPNSRSIILRSTINSVCEQKIKRERKMHRRAQRARASSGMRYKTECGVGCVRKPKVDGGWYVNEKKK